MKQTIVFSLLGLLFFATCKSNKYYAPVNDFAADARPTAPDYSNPYYWAALPTQADEADKTPRKDLVDAQAQAAADVFYIYPTIYSGRKANETHWNAPVDDAKFRKTVEEQAILNQASVFNGAAKVYAPFYRQAHIDVYYTSNKANAKEALDFAYNDVKTAFEYYLAHYNNGRPIIIASHSQGTTHAGRLLREYFDAKPLQKQLVAAYTIGMPIPKAYFKNLKPCQTPTETGCFCGWRTFERGFEPQRIAKGDSIWVTNPISWRTDTTYVPKTASEGSILFKFNKIYPNLTDAQIHNGILWCSRPSFFGNFAMSKKMKNYHIGDYNLYYMNIRNNAIARVKAFTSAK